MGYPFWSSDIECYSGGLDREITTRWLGFGCFCPIMEVGPTEDRGLWNLDDELSYNSELLTTWRLYARLHYRLKNYTYQYASEGHNT